MKYLQSFFWVIRYLRVSRERDLIPPVKEGVDTLLMYLYRALNRMEYMEQLASSSNSCVVVCLKLSLVSTIYIVWFVLRYICPKLQSNLSKYKPQEHALCLCLLVSSGTYCSYALQSRLVIVRRMLEDDPATCMGGAGGVGNSVK